MKTVLLADDEANLRLLVRTTLSDPGYRLLEASDGEEALQVARAEHPDLLILDWMMPGLSGMEVAESLHEDPITAGIPVLMLTAKGHDKDRERAQAAGVRAYLGKPFSPLELLETVDHVLKG